jgi:dehydrogenase/reductase SDR family protein 12
MPSLLDRSVVASFDRTGFRRHARRFAVEPERALSGRRALITGGTSGIGLAAAGALAGRGASVEVWGRTPDRGEAAAASIGGSFRAVDLGDLAAVAAAAHQAPVDGLAAVVLNAGGMPHARTLTPQGHELVWASQVLGHFLLLRVLRERGALGPQTRVVWVSSGGMYMQRLDLRDLRRDDGYQRHTVYANAKRAQVILGELLAARWPEVPMAVMHPGWVRTAAVKTAMPLFYALTRPTLRTPDEGADTVVWLMAREAAWPSGRFWFDRAEAPTHKLKRTRTRAGDRDALWARVTADVDRR